MSRFVLLAVMGAWAMVGTGALRAGTNVWTSLGPASGPVRAIAIDPQNSGTVYAASDAGLFKSGNSGASWRALSPGPPCCILTLVMDPQTPSTIYDLAYDFKTHATEVFKSTDGGTNWSPVNSGLPADAGGRYVITSLAIDPQNPTTLYAGNALRGGGVFKTTDGGESWTAVNSGLPDGGVMALAINPQDPDTIYGSTRGVFKSTDGGASWSAVNSGLENDIGSCCSALAIDPQNPDTIYAAGYDTALYKTTNGGTRWTLGGYGLLFGYGRQADSVTAIAIDPRDSNIVYAGTSAGAFKSTDGGISWSAVKSRLTTDANGPLYISALAIDPQNPDTVYATGTYTGVFKTTDAGASWTTVYSEPTTPIGLTVLRIDPQNPGTMYAGTPVGIFKTTDAGASWTAVNAGLPNDTNGNLTISTLAIDPQTPSTIYALYVVTSADMGFWLGGGVFKSADGGVNWTRLNTPGDYLTGLTRGLAIDPQNPSIVYAGISGGVIKTTDGGASWRWVNSGFPVDRYSPLPNHQTLSVTTLAIDPRNSGTVYAGSFVFPGWVFKTTTGGASWTAVNSGLTGFYDVEILAIDGQNPSTVYAKAVVAGSDYPLGGLLYKTTTGGASWTAVNSGLPNNVTALAIDPLNSNTVYAGTGSGVFRSTDGGTNWVAVNSGLTTLSVTTLAIDSQSPGTVYAGTSDGKVFGMTFAPEP